jgi:hypothetical protein
LENGRSHAQSSTLQKTTEKITTLYFRSNPFEGNFSQFLNHLMNDPTLLNKTEFKRTDSSLYYISGEYKHHKPFFFISTRTRVVLAESEIVINDSLHQTETIFFYQLAGYLKTSDNGEKEAIREFEKFDRKYRNKFIKNNYSELKKGGQVYGAVQEYFDKKHAFSPLSIAWQRIDDPDECVFVITIRFQVIENTAFIPSYIIID